MLNGRGSKHKHDWMFAQLSVRPPQRKAPQIEIQFSCKCGNTRTQELTVKTPASTALTDAERSMNEQERAFKKRERQRMLNEDQIKLMARLYPSPNVWEDDYQPGTLFGKMKEIGKMVGNGKV
jgi:uncharacterized membrane protein YcgQ (UPF0703/DUF1980 family)